MSTNKATLAVIGGGNMGGSIVRGAVRAGLAKPAEIVVAEPAPEKRRALSDVALTRESAREAVADLRPDGVVLLAVKPQFFAAVGDELSLAGGIADRPVISIMAGVPLEKLERVTGSRRVVRAMPNLPVSVGKGMTAIAPGAGAMPDDLAFASSLFASIGEVVRIDEGLMDAFTAVAGSGPAYVFHLAEAMDRAARDMGFDQATSIRMVRQTISGAAALLAAREESPAELREAVTSKGGTTAAALGVLAEMGVSDTMVRAIRAARDRGRELAGE